MNQEQLHEKIEFNHVRELIEWAGDVYGEQTAYSFRVNPHEDTVTEISYQSFRGDVRAGVRYAFHGLRRQTLHPDRKNDL